MEERLKIIVEADGTFSIKRQLHDIGTAGNNAAKQVRESWQAAYAQLKWQTKVAMNSTRLAEQDRVNTARAASNEIIKLRRAEAKAAQDAARVASAASRQAGRVEVAEARARRRAEAAHRTKIRDAKKDATFGLGTSFGAVAGLLGLGAAISGFVQYSDSATNVANRLKQVTSSTEELNGLTQRLRSSALDARSEFDLTTRTYARLAQSTKQLNLGQSANLAMTETLTKAIAVSGATGAEAHATLIQLSQAMASNRLSADEFRSVSEQLPIILDLLAASTGRARTELKDMGEAGKLGAQTLALALMEGLEKIRADFDKTMPTIEQQWENVKTQTRFAIDEFNKATGAAKEVTDALSWMANNMDTVTAAVKALGAMVGVYLVAQIGFAASAMKTLALANPWIAAAVGLTALISLVVQYRKEINDAAGDMGYFAAAHSIPASQWTPEMRNAVLTGKTPAQTAREAAEYEARKYDMRQDVLARQQEEDDIIRLKMQSDLPTGSKKDKKGRRGRHVPTFDEAVQSLRNDVKEASLSENQREVFKQGVGISASIQRDLTEAEQRYVVELVKEKIVLEELQAARERIAEQKEKDYERDTKHIVEMKKMSEDARDEARKIRKEQLEMENNIFAGRFGDVDVKEGRRTVRDMLKGGRLGRDKAEFALEELEIQDPKTKDARKSFLQEMHGSGKLAEDINGLFGPEGTLNQGLADATANAIVFGQSFSSAINSLGKQIQAEIISSLVKAGIRMAMLGIMGGGEAAPGVGIVPVGGPASQGGFFSPRGKGYAMGGYTGNNGRTKIAGYVHGGEHVMKADSTQRIGRGNLDYMNKTGQIPGGRGVNVKIINNTGVRMEQQQGMTRDEVVLIAREEGAKQSGRVVAGNIRDPNSHVSKALRGNTNTRYQR